jgi:P27 family predicted phage terminase small subunit
MSTVIHNTPFSFTKTIENIKGTFFIYLLYGGKTMKGGNNRKPSQLKKLKGTYRKTREVKNEPEPPQVGGWLEPPSELGPHGSKKWYELFPLLTTTGIMTVADLSTFELLCKNYQLMNEIEYALTHYTDEEGVERERKITDYLRTVNSQTAYLWKSYRESMDTYRRCLQEFGMTPVARARVEAVEKPKKSEEEVKGENLLKMVK